MKCSERAAPQDSRGAPHPPPRKTPLRQGSPCGRGEGGTPAFHFRGKCRNGGRPPTCSCGETEARDGRRLFPSPRAAVPVPKYSPAREWAARGAALALGPLASQQTCREEPDSPGPERSGRDEREAPAAARAREGGPRRGEGRGWGRGHGPRSTPDAAGRTRRWLGPLSGRRACQ